MLGFILLVVVAVAIVWYVINDMNQPLAKKIETKIHSVADVNKDGVVNVNDAKAVVTKTKKAAKSLKKSKKAE